MLKVDTGLFHTVLIKSDGNTISYGKNEYGSYDIPDLPENTFYTQVVCSLNNTILLRSYGK